MTYVHEKMPPLLIQHGRQDGLVPVEQSILFAERLGRYVQPDRYAFDILEGAGHADPRFETRENLERVFAFLDLHLK